MILSSPFSYFSLPPQCYYLFFIFFFFKEQNRTFAPQISSLNAEIFSQDRTKRLVRDNIDVRETAKAYRQLSAELVLLKGEEGAGGIELREAQRQYQSKY